MDDLARTGGDRKTGLSAVQVFPPQGGVALDSKQDLPEQNKPKRSKFIPVLLCVLPVLVILYVGSYCALSLAGEYVLVDKNGLMYREWCPRFLARQDGSNIPDGPRVEITRLGSCYMPLMAVDGLFWHKSIQDHLWP